MIKDNRTIISLIDFADGGDTSAERDTAIFARAMAYCKEHEGTTLIVPPGEYLITSELARETQQKVMTGEYGGNPQPIMFNPKFVYTRGISFEGQRGTTMIGYGVTLMVDGFMEPVSVRECADVTVLGITIDHVRKPYSKGTVMSAEAWEDGKFDVTVKLDESSPVCEKTPLGMRYVLYNTFTNQYFIPRQHGVHVADQYTLVITMDDDRVTATGQSYVGMEYYTLHSFHSRPAILIEYAKNIYLEDVTIHSQPGMGIVGNRSENVTISRLSVVPSCGHHFSTNTDATHFTSMKGLLRLENSTFDGQGDDFINVHNYYHTITPIESEMGCTCYIHTDAVDGTHTQSLDHPDAGDVLELTRRDSLEVTGTYTVVNCTPLPEENRAKVTLDHLLPSAEECGKYLLADVTRLPRLEVVGCHARNHFARSILVKTRDVLLSDNTFTDVFGPAIVIAAESWWSEGVCARDVVIRRNHVVNTRVPWGESGGIVVKADCDKPETKTIRNIVIEDNTIDCPRAEHGIFVRNTDGLVLRRNRIHTKGQGEVVTNCENVSDCDAGC